MLKKGSLFCSSKLSVVFLLLFERHLGRSDCFKHHFCLFSDDEPDTDGCPSHYVVINGVYDARVLKCLMDLGVTADAVIKVKSEIGQTDVEQNPTGEEKNMVCRNHNL